MADFLGTLAQSAQETINSGYYEAINETATSHISLKKAILETKNAPVITEIKAASPSAGTIRNGRQ
jgi:indole-3-glycerol phosphate synthase